MQSSENHMLFPARSCFCLLVLLIGSGCKPSPGQAPHSPAHVRPLVHVDNYPLFYFVQRLAGDRVECILAVPPGEDPAFWVPPVEVITQMQKADLILLNGAGYAHWRDKVSLPESRVIETAESFRNNWMPIENPVTHAHGNAPAHSHSGTAFTTWIDFQQAAMQARVAHDALLKLLPDQKKDLADSLAALDADLQLLDDQMHKIVRPLQNRPVIVSHPVYEYWGRRYGLKLKSLHWEPDERLNDNHLKELAGLLENHPAKWLIWEGVPLPENDAMLARHGLKTCVFTPCSNQPEEGDFLSVMRQNLERLSVISGQPDALK